MATRPMAHRCHGACGMIGSAADNSFTASDTAPETKNSGCSVAANVFCGHRLACA